MGPSVARGPLFVALVQDSEKQEKPAGNDLTRREWVCAPDLWSG
jgi:hypothetical protein